MLFRHLQPSNAITPIEVTPEGMVMLSKDEQPHSPIEVILSGRVILFRHLQP